MEQMAHKMEAHRARLERAMGREKFNEAYCKLRALDRAEEKRLDRVGERKDDGMMSIMASIRDLPIVHHATMPASLSAARSDQTDGTSGSDVASSALRENPFLTKESNLHFLARLQVLMGLEDELQSLHRHIVQHQRSTPLQHSVT
jgi:hypothetical protein